VDLSSSLCKRLPEGSNPAPKHHGISQLCPKTKPLEKKHWIVDEYGGNMEIDGNIQGGAPKIAKLVYNSNN